MINHSLAFLSDPPNNHFFQDQEHIHESFILKLNTLLQFFSLFIRHAHNSLSKKPFLTDFEDLFISWRIYLHPL